MRNGFAEVRGVNAISAHLRLAVDGLVFVRLLDFVDCAPHEYNHVHPERLVDGRDRHQLERL
ncbi:MAG: hypothetical protein OXU20_37395 [Myxococcales bacterium]|nr:hypothetical protein [Myxococcales bacterium]MDD9969456.1 hypothetical protein [Myxococcales bacterium]